MLLSLAPPPPRPLLLQASLSAASSDAFFRDELYGCVIGSGAADELMSRDAPNLEAFLVRWVQYDAVQRGAGAAYRYESSVALYTAATRRSSGAWAFLVQDSMA